MKRDRSVAVKTARLVRAQEKPMKRRKNRRVANRTPVLRTRVTDNTNRFPRLRDFDVLWCPLRSDQSGAWIKEEAEAIAMDHQAYRAAILAFVSPPGGVYEP